MTVCAYFCVCLVAQYRAHMHKPWNNVDPSVCSHMILLDVSKLLRKLFKKHALIEEQKKTSLRARVLYHTCALMLSS